MHATAALEPGFCGLARPNLCATNVRMCSRQNPAFSPLNTMKPGWYVETRNGNLSYVYTRSMFSLIHATAALEPGFCGLARPNLCATNVRMCSHQNPAFSPLNTMKPTWYIETKYETCHTCTPGACPNLCMQQRP
jgi:hypothetical protein